jgi:hypothetical protein
VRRRDDELFRDDIGGVILGEDLNTPHIPYKDHKNRSTGPRRDSLGYSKSRQNLRPAIDLPSRTQTDLRAS